MIANLTVPALKTLIADMNERQEMDARKITAPSKARKAEIIALIDAEMVILIDEAYVMDRQVDLDRSREIERQEFITEFLAEADAPSIEQIDSEYRANLPAPFVMLSQTLAQEAQEGRVRAYLAQRGTYKLTAAQWRRIRKNNRRHGLITGIRNDRSVSVTLV